MNTVRRPWLPLTVLVAAVALLVGSFVWVSGAGWGPRAMMGAGGYGAAMAGDGPVDDLAGAQRAAGRFADRWGLTVGEVMEFDNGFYAELAEPSGELATEVLVDRRTGSVQIEFGPAMMWNTAYGMHRGRAPTVDAAQAEAIAADWLADNRAGESAGEADAFPGYYTVHTMDDDQITGMLSVHAVSGAVWYHGWHGEFVALAEPR